MDSIDQKILDLLVEDGRASFTRIADEVDVSEGTVRNRVDRMKDEGIIEKFTVETQEKSVSAVLLATLRTEKAPSSVTEALPEGLNYYEVTGEHDLIIMMDMDDSAELNQVIDEIRKIDGVRETVTKSVLKEGTT